MNKIGVFDSGIGGLSVLEKLVEVLPGEDFLYYGDSKNCPYGTKSQDELIKIVSRIVDYFINNDCKLIVIACNTATTRCMKSLREMYPDMIFVGTVPAVKMACDNKCHDTLVLATEGTIASERVHELILDNKNDDQEIYLVACNGLAEAIEEKNNELIDSILYNTLKEYLDYSIDSVVLGCTHYPWAKENISKLFPNAKLFDGSLGVAREVKRQLELHNLNGTGKGEVIIIDKID
jgi:glutamate racemase